jgi:hypothetical protein
MRSATSCATCSSSRINPFDIALRALGRFSCTVAWQSSTVKSRYWQVMVGQARTSSTGQAMLPRTGVQKRRIGACRACKLAQKVQNKKSLASRWSAGLLDW